MRFRLIFRCSYTHHVRPTGVGGAFLVLRMILARPINGTLNNVQLIARDRRNQTKTKSATHCHTSFHSHLPHLPRTERWPFAMKFYSGVFRRLHNGLELAKVTNIGRTYRVSPIHGTVLTTVLHQWGDPNFYHQSFGPQVHRRPRPLVGP